MTWVITILIIDYVTVNENAIEPPLEIAEGAKDQINTASQLSSEATFIVTNFAQQCLRESAPEKYEFQNPNPFNVEDEDPETLASRGYRYRKFNLSAPEDESPITLLVRTEVDALMKSAAGEEQFITVKALNEFDSKTHNAIDWRSKLDSQRGAVVATEMKNNSCKLARWAVQSHLADAAFMKIGYFYYLLDSNLKIRESGSASR
jgi:translation initiation factor 3 subunit D